MEGRKSGHGEAGMLGALILAVIAGLLQLTPSSPAALRALLST